MKKNKPSLEKDIRLKAEEHVRKSKHSSGDITLPTNEEEVQSLLYELQVRQIELEMQNENLRRAQAETAVQYRVSEILADSPSFAEAAPLILETICERLGWDTGAFWIVETSQESLRFVADWHRPSPTLDHFIAASKEYVFMRGIGLPGVVWERNAPVWVSDMEQTDVHLPRRALFREVGLRSLMGFPITFGGTTIGMMEFLSTTAQESDAAVLELMEALSRQIAQFLKRKEAENELQMLSMVASKTTNSVIITDTDGYATWVNEGFTNLTEYSAAEVLGKQPRSLMLGADSNLATVQIMKDATRQGVGFEVEILCYTKSKRPFWVNIKADPISEENGVPGGFIAIQSDITERKRREQELVLLHDILNRSQDTIEIVEETGRYFYANDRACAYIGHQREELYQKHIQEVMPRFYDQGAWEQHVQDLKKGSLAFETTITFGDGAPIIAEFIISSLVVGDKRYHVAVSHDITQRKRYEQELQQSNARITSLLESIPFPIAVTRRGDGKPLFNNAPMQKFLGLSSNINEHPVAIDYYQHPEDRARVLEELRTKGRINELELALKKPDGSHWWALLSMILIEFEGEQALFSAFQDISLRKSAEQALQESYRELENFKTALDTAMLVSTMDVQGKLLHANQQFLDLSGYSLQELIGQNYHSILNSGFHPPEFFSTMWRTLHSGKPWRGAMCTRAKDGTEYWLDKLISPMLNKDGTVYQYMSISHDITQQRRMEEQQLQKLSLVTSKTTNAVIITDAEGYITWVNEGFTHLTEYSLAEVIGNKPGKLLQGTDTDRAAIESMRDALRLGNGFEVEILNYTKSNRPYWLHIKTDPLYDSKGALEGFVAIETDITARKKVEQALRESEERYRLIFASSSEGILQSLSDGTIEAANSAACLIFGLSENELRQRNRADIIDRNDARLPLMLKERRRVGFVSGELNFVRANGEVFPGEFSSTVYLDAQGIQHIAVFLRDISERKKLEQTLRKNAALFSAALQSLSEGMMVIGLDGTIQVANQSAERIMGFSAEQMVGRATTDPAWGIIQEDGTPYSSENLPPQITLRTGEPQTEVLMGVQRSEGTLRWITVNSQPMVLENDDTMYGVIITFADVTERRSAEKELRRNEGNMRALFESSVQAYYLLDKNYGILSFNKVARDIVKSYFGKTLSVGDSMLDYPLPERFVECYQRALEGEWVFDDRVATFPNNQRRYFEVLYSPVYDDMSELIGISYNVLDVTERKELQLQVTEYSERLQSIILSMMDGVVLLDAERSITLVNPAAESIFGYRSTELLSQPLTMLLPDEALRVHEQNVEKFIGGNAPNTPRHKSHTVKGRHKSGRTFPMEASIAYFSVEGQLFLLAVVRDITARVEAEEEILDLNRNLTRRVEERTVELVKLNKEKDEFLGIAAHDLKNPLAAIRSSAQIIEECFTGGETINFAEYADSIIATSDDMLDIITNFLDIELIESGKLGLALERVPLTIVNKAVASHRRRARAKDITIHYDEPTTSVSIIADKLAFRQVLDNLLSNAVKFSPPAKHIHVRVLERQVLENITMTSDAQDRYVRIEIRDEGPGIGEDEQNKLFQKFSRLSAKPTGEEGSTGLGLSIVKKLVEMMNGQVWCESVQGEGATFIVELPII